MKAYLWGVHGNARVSIIGVLCAALLASGCRSTVIIPRRQLRNLDGFTEGEVRYFYDAQGRTIPFTSSTPLLLLTNSRGHVSQRFVEIEVDQETFRGLTPEGYPFTLELGDIAQIRMVVGRPGKTIGITMAIVGGVTLILMIVLLFYLAAQEASDHD